MLQTKTRIVSLVCNASNKTPQNVYKIPMGALSSESVIGVSLKSAVYRNVFYNVVGIDGNPELQNYKFNFKLDGTPYSVEIPSGFYSINDLLPLVQAGVDAILAVQILPIPTAVFAYSSITGKVTLTYTDNGNNQIFEISGGDDLDSINLLLGNVSNFTLDGLIPTPYQFENIIDLSGVDATQLIFEEVSRGAGLSNTEKNNFGNTTNMLSLLNYDGSPFGSLKSYINPEPSQTMLLYDSPVNLSNMTIFLTTTSGIILDLGSSDLHIELLLALK